MASKLNPFQAQIFELLNARGQSYRMVCAHLLTLGVEVSPQALHGWHTRRMRKIKQRNAQLGSIAVPIEPASAAQDSVVQVSATTQPVQNRLWERPQSDADADTDAAVLPASSGSQGAAALRKQIEQEEKRIFSNIYMQLVQPRQTLRGAKGKGLVGSFSGKSSKERR